MRPDDSDVLNLLGLVYFKTNAFPEAEVIYRRLASENPNVFILHSNLGLILFKQTKLEEAEQFLLRAVELRPNYAKSHLYLGLLYRQKKKYGIALEHLRFAGADKVVREVEAEMRPQRCACATTTSTSCSKAGRRANDAKRCRRSRRFRPTKRFVAQRWRTPRSRGTSRHRRRRARAESAAHTAARKLQDAVDETQHIEGGSG